MTAVVTLVAVIALCGTGFGYVMGQSSLTEGWRAAAFDRQVVAWRNYGDATDSRSRRRHLAAAKFWDGAFCRVCAGWWACAAAGVWLALVADATLPGWGWWPPVILAACTVHTIATNVLPAPDDAEDGL